MEYQGPEMLSGRQTHKIMDQITDLTIETENFPVRERRDSAVTSISSSATSDKKLPNFKNPATLILAVTTAGMIYSSIASTYLLAKNNDNKSDITVKSTFIRWGKQSCTHSSTLEFEGYAHTTFDMDGKIAGGDVLCMPFIISGGKSLTLNSENGTVIKRVGVNLLNLSPSFTDENQTTYLECELCQTESSYTITLFGRSECEGLVKLYSGYAVGHPSINPICIDPADITESYKPVNREILTPVYQVEYLIHLPCVVCHSK